MTGMTFGIDFGTTNSLAASIIGDRPVPLTDDEGRPHPSVIWYRGSDIVIGREAKQHLDIDQGGAPPGFVRSPKMSLRRQGPIFVDGRPVDPVDAVAEVLKHLKKDAAVARERAPGRDLGRAVMTIPVDFGGPERRALRQAARAAGISVVQFVHEPVAALYGYLRSQPDMNRELARLEGRSVLVFDWGGGTLDLTLCKIQGGSIMQVANAGDNEIGGDEFDNRLRNLFREKHASAHKLDDISALEQPGMAAKLLNQCEIVKINLSNPNTESEEVFIGNYLKVEGPSRHLVNSVTRAELEEVSQSIVARGLALIDSVLARARLTYQDIELCLATGGMVNMPAIQAGLTERFVGRVPKLDNGDRIIAEGAAWIAHDGLRLTLSKPIEILVADSSGRGAYYPLVPAGLQLPVENQVIPATNTRLYCVDPREGIAVVELAKPARIGTANPEDPRSTLCVLNLPVDPKAQPLLERLECHLQIDHDYVSTVILRSTGRGAEARSEFHDLEFGLALPVSHSAEAGGDPEGGHGKPKRGPASVMATATSTVTQRTNLAINPDGTLSTDDLWRLVPGDILAQWRPHHFDNRTATLSPRQALERSFYTPCSRCKRLESQILSEGPVEECRGRRCGADLPPKAPDHSLQAKGSPRDQFMGPNA
jgi:molecular chaperone DnaK